MGALQTVRSCRKDWPSLLPIVVDQLFQERAHGARHDPEAATPEQDHAEKVR